MRPCTTPIARTPSLPVNPGWGVAMDMSRSRRNSVSSPYLEDQMDIETTMQMNSLQSHTSTSSAVFMDDIEQDERSVEDLLIPSPPSSAPLFGSQIGSAFTSSTPQKSTNLSNIDQLHAPYMSGPDMSPSSPTGSTFTSTDPFYIAQLQSLNNATHSQSLFAQNGRLPQNSPFALREHLHLCGQFDKT